MNAYIERHFAKMGARVKLRDRAAAVRGAGISIDVGRDGFGEFYDIAASRNDAQSLCVLDLQPRMRHLLLMYRRPSAGANSKFLCGHDERAWFVAAVPEATSATSVRTAMEALKPPAVRILQEQLRVKPKRRNRRRNEAFVRQGEWFFVPSGWPSAVEAWMIRRNEPLRRGNGKPHIAEELIRLGGETVYVSHRHPRGLTLREYEKLISRMPELRRLRWVVQRRNPQVFVRGKIRHADHKTIYLDGWHQVLMNTETQALAMRHVAFID